MDKIQEVRRSLNRPKKKLVSGCEESRKEKKVKRLSSVADMEPRKFSKKIFGEPSTVDRASVPRKLRSAIRKRGCDSGSVALPDSKNSNNLLTGVEPHRMKCLKKSKINTKNGCLDHSLKRAASAPISKDEEEVAATLFAMAEMIPLSELCVKKGMDEEASKGKALDVAEKHENSMPVTRVLKEEPEVSCLPSGEVIITTPVKDSLVSTSVQEKSLTGPEPLTWLQLSERKPVNLNIKVSVPPVNLQTTTPLLQTCDHRPLFNSAFFQTSTGSITESGLNEIKQEKTFIPNSSSVMRTGEVDVENQDATPVERRLNGGASRAFHDSGVYGLNSKPSSINFPSWLSTNSPPSGLGRHDLSTDKLSFSTNDRRTSWKRCAAHVYISHLIRVMQISQAKESQALETRQLEQFNSLSGSLIASHHFNSARNKANGRPPNTDMFSSSDCKNFHDSSNAISVNYRHNQEEQAGSSFSGYSGSKKQSFDFLSLSFGVNQANDSGINKSVNSLQTGAKGHVLHQQFVTQDIRPKQFPSAHNSFPSNPYCDQVAPVSIKAPPTPPQGSLQVPHYLSNPFVPAHMFNGMTSTQQPQSEHQQQQQQQIWTTQLAAQFRPGPLLSPHITNCQRGRKDLQSSTYMESLKPSFQSLAECRGKYHHISQQQPQLIALGQSLGPTKANHQHSQLASMHEDNTNQFRPNNVLPLQLTLQ